METAANPHFDLEGRTAAVDRVAIPHFPDRQDLALLAVGGYGRREMFPYSDVDILILTESGKEAPREPVSTFLRTLWDAGLRVSQSVHNAEECLTLDDINPELSISLLDHRFLTGNETLYKALHASIEAFFRRKQSDLLRMLARLTRERHQRFQNTIFHLEPNLKDGPGGLRDFQVIRWFARLQADPGHSGESVPAGQAICDLRWQLHTLSGRDNNVLNFEAQDKLAESGSCTADSLMSGFYRNARKLQRACTGLLDAEEMRDSQLFARFRDRRSRLSNADFTVTRGLVYFRAPQHDLPRLFEFVARHGVPLAPDTGRRVHAGLQPSQAFLWKDLQPVLTLPHAGLALREMHETGLLLATFPELLGIEGLVIRDYYHQYTVDEHTLVTIDSLIKLRSGEDRFSELAREQPDLSLLILALIFHDAGKSDPDEGHSEGSARLAGPALERIGVPPKDIETVLFLIRAHLELSATMNSRDISDPATARAIAERVGTAENLKLLTLLTYADISAVNPAAMTPWRSSLLWQLYSATHRELLRELQTGRIHISSHFLEGLPVRYQLTHEEEDVQRHIRMAAEGTAVEIAKKGAIYTLTLVSPDRPFLFAAVAGAISSFTLNILKAEAFSNARGVSINIFTFADPIRTLELNPGEADSLKATVKRVALGHEDIAVLLKKRPPPRFSSFAPRIGFDNDASPDSTLIQIVAADRPGLLYDVTSALSAGGCNIEVVLVDTQGRKAIDVFYVTPKLEPEALPEWSTRLSAVV